MARDAHSIHLLPRGHGLWAPAGTEYSTYVAPGSDAGSTSLHVAPLPSRLTAVATFEMPAAALALASRMGESGASAGSERDTWALVSRLVTPAHRAMTIALPSDPSLREIAEQILGDPTGPHVTERYAAAAGVRATTLSSRFRHQTGLSLAQWHAHARLYAAVVLLGRGISTGEVAHAVGFSGPSGLSDAHKRLFGVTPMAFKRRGHRSNPLSAVGSELERRYRIVDPPEWTPPAHP